MLLYTDNKDVIVVEIAPDSWVPVERHKDLWCVKNPACDGGTWVDSYLGRLLATLKRERQQVHTFVTATEAAQWFGASLDLEDL